MQGEISYKENTYTCFVNTSEYTALQMHMGIYNISAFLCIDTTKLEMEGLFIVAGDTKVYMGE